MNDHFVFERSKVLRSAKYDRQNMTMTVHLEDGSKWLYEDVPIAVYRKLTEARSHGTYFNTAVKNVFTGKLLGKV